jgi:hypothetical protein
MNNCPMAEQGRSGDETVIGRTAGAPNPNPDDQAELAWSQGNDADPAAAGNYGSDDRRPVPARPDPTEGAQSWGATVQRAGALLGICLVVAGGIFLVHWLTSSPKSPEKKPDTPSAAAPSTSVSTLPPVMITSTQGQDNTFIAALKNKGIGDLDPQGAIANGKTVCQNLSQGESLEQVRSEFVRQSQFPGNANDFVTAAINVYCPQYDNLVSGG